MINEMNSVGNIFWSMLFGPCWHHMVVDDWRMRRPTILFERHIPFNSTPGEKAVNWVSVILKDFSYYFITGIVGRGGCWMPSSWSNIDPCQQHKNALPLLKAYMMCFNMFQMIVWMITLCTTYCHHQKSIRSASNGRTLLSKRRFFSDVNLFK